jgi:hypothetical protein
MDASDLIKTLHNPLAGGGPSTYGGQITGPIHSIHPKAMPMVLTMREEIDVWMNAPAGEALKLQRSQIAYLRDPSIMTLQALEKSKTAEAVALDILDTEIRRLASTRATTVTGLKLKASYAFTDGKLAGSIVGDLLQL